ncbi:MAG: tetratricopeptide repeat protein [Cyanobacteria bacterium SZAS LIN-5]|nr:tetratricopeptide repeat protein [Cyanobacteria bacterium SZAS LIN-5]RTL40724.1 MAG: tetratricopeptide repeat protein [Candidatus Melainabacteria bacterium]
MTISVLLKVSLPTALVCFVSLQPTAGAQQPITLTETGPRRAEAPMPLMERGKLEKSHRDFDGAISSFTEALGLNMNNTDALFERGQCYYYQNKFAEARSDFERVMQAAPYDCQPVLWIGTIEAKQGNDDKAVENYLQAFKLNPQLVKQFLKDQGKAKTQTVNPKNQGAVTAYEKAVAKYLVEHPELNEPKTADSSASTQTTHSSKEDLQELLNKQNEYIKDNPTDAAEIFRRGKTYKRLGEADKALADFNEAIKLDSTKSRFYLARARLYHEQNKLELSQADVEKAQSLDPTIPHHINFDEGN